MEDKLIESEEKLRTLFDSVNDAIFILDQEGNFVDINKAAHERLGYTKQEMLSMNISSIDSPEVADKVPERFEQIRKYGFAVFESAHMRKDGSVMRVEVNTRLRDLQGKKMVFSVIRDITDRKIVEEELRGHKEHLEKLVYERTCDFQTAINFLQEEIEFRIRTEEALRKNEAKMRHLHGMKVLGELAAGVAHEVRNPLHALMSVTEALKKELQDNPDFDIFIFHISRQVERLSVLMKDLLDLGKPIEPSNLTEEPLSEICLAAIDLWKTSPSRRGHAVSLIQPPADRSVVIGDSQRLQQVFLNLLENAAYHSPEGSSIEVVISGVGGNMAENIVTVNVIDRGTGIPEERLPRIFEPFYTTRRGGTGLGLSIIKNILDGHNGSLAVRNNRPLPGCTVEVTLPLAGGVKQ